MQFIPQETEGLFLQSDEHMGIQCFDHVYQPDKTEEVRILRLAVKAQAL